MKLMLKLLLAAEVLAAVVVAALVVLVADLAVADVVVVLQVVLETAFLIDLRDQIDGPRSELGKSFQLTADIVNIFCLVQRPLLYRNYIE